MNTVTNSQITVSQIRKHIELKIAQANLNPYPFPHLIIENFFPEAVFSQILEYNPFQKNQELFYKRSVV